MYIFNHVFKTGGTSFNLSYLPAAFQPDEYLVLRGSQEPNQEDLQRVIGFSAEQRSRLKLIAGHNTDDLRPYYPDARYLALVREPTSRAISAYLHAKHHEDAWEVTGRAIFEQNLGLGQFAEAIGFEKEHDLQSKLLLGRAFAPSGPPSDAEMTETIRSRYHLIGYTEAFELFIFYLHVTENFPLVLFNKRLVRKERAAFQPTDKDMEVIDYFNRMDRCLYRCARLEFDRKVAEIWTDETEQLYRNYSEALESYRSETQGDPNAGPLLWPFQRDQVEAVGVDLCPAQL